MDIQFLTTSHFSTLFFWSLQCDWKSWIRLPFFMVFIFFFFSLMALGETPMPYFLWGPLMGIFFIMFSLFSFDESIGSDVKDGTLWWLMSQNRAGVCYLWSKACAFSLNMAFVCLIICAFFSRACGISLFLIGVQGVFLAAYLSLVRHTQGLPFGQGAMSLFVLPMCVPSFFLLTEIWRQPSIWWNGLCILAGLTLLSFVIGTVAFERVREA
jgi:hypothetical protein